MNKTLAPYLLLLLLIALLFVLNLFVGSVGIPPSDILSILLGSFSGSEAWRFIILETRLPQALTALLCGGALSVSGLMLQTAFRNPLAGPGIFGINSGAALGVALVMLLGAGSISLFSIGGFLAILLAAFAGAMLVTLLIFFFSTIVRNSVMLLIIGIMIGYLSSSAISLLNFLPPKGALNFSLFWGLVILGVV